MWERIIIGQTEMTRRAERPDRWERAEGVVSGGADTFALDRRRREDSSNSAHPFGHDRGVLVWDFTDFGLAVDMFLPPAEKVT